MDKPEHAMSTDQRQQSQRASPAMQACLKTANISLARENYTVNTIIKER